jgi:hypothetical protein
VVSLCPIAGDASAGGGWAQPRGAALVRRVTEDVAAEVRGRLLDLQRAQMLARWLDRRPQLDQDVFARGKPEPLGTFLGAQHQVDVIEFLWAAMELFGGGEEPGVRLVYRPRWADLRRRPRGHPAVLSEAPEGAPLGRLLPDVPEEGAIAIPEALRWRAACGQSPARERGRSRHCAGAAVRADPCLQGGGRGAALCVGRWSGGDVFGLDRYRR